MANQEHPFFWGDPPNQLFGVFHRPEVKKKLTTFVFCHPFAEEKLWAHRVYVSLARKLANRGYPALRFDFAGHGDSMGSFADTDLETRLRDISLAVETAMLKVEKAPSVALFGVRLGATLAALFAERSSVVKTLVLWQPIIDGASYMQELLRSNLAAQMAIHGKVKIDRKELTARLNAGETVEVEGYSLSGKMFDQISQVRLDKQNGMQSLQALILQMSPKEGVSLTPGLKNLASQYKSGELKLVQEEPFWKEIRRWYSSAPNAQEVTLGWVEENCD